MLIIAKRGNITLPLPYCFNMLSESQTTIKSAITLAHNIFLHASLLLNMRF